MESRKVIKPYGPPRWWESAAGAPLAYFVVLGGSLGGLVLVKELLVIVGLL